MVLKNLNGPIYDIHSLDTAMDDSNIGHYTGALSGSMGTGVAMLVLQMGKVLLFSGMVICLFDAR